MAPRRHSGFTLIEVMIVVIIVGILMSVALPSYQESLRKGRRAEAKAAMADVANRQEAFMLDRSSYTDDMTRLGFGADPFTSAEGHYSIDSSGACDPNGPSDITRCYTVTATPVSGGIQDEDTRCHTFSLSSRGSKTALKKDGSDADDLCW
ncbi:prepilin-type N-terminal cleavage/methylation domain-containing protein [Halioglobus maricola]|uniref:Prepilin-type N-terminal cleavage/methylation domain-containing protein n=2 Tax=Halioglobus maricola TaxID=2601894 RepID=A0A5P9NQ63_9GAMM|nr:prepilin-type N-terminal cleavage/methylation domain-containing protein [Halioglobus maricola]